MGTYDSTSANNVEGLELTENSGIWAPSHETNLPAASGSNPEVWLASVYMHEGPAVRRSGNLRRQ